MYGAGGVRKQFDRRTVNADDLILQLLTLPDSLTTTNEFSLDDETRLPTLQGDGQICIEISATILRDRGFSPIPWWPEWNLLSAPDDSSPGSFTPSSFTPGSFTPARGRSLSGTDRAIGAHEAPDEATTLRLDGISFHRKKSLGFSRAAPVRATTAVAGATAGEAEEARRESNGAQTSGAQRTNRQLAASSSNGVTFDNGVTDNNGVAMQSAVTYVSPGSSGRVFLAGPVEGPLPLPLRFQGEVPWDSTEGGGALGPWAMDEVIGGSFVDFGASDENVWIAVQTAYQWQLSRRRIINLIENSSGVNLRQQLAYLPSVFAAPIANRSVAECLTTTMAPELRGSRFAVLLLNGSNRPLKMTGSIVAMATAAIDPAKTRSGSDFFGGIAILEASYIIASWTLLLCAIGFGGYVCAKFSANHLTAEKVLLLLCIVLLSVRMTVEAQNLHAFALTGEIGSVRAIYTSLLSSAAESAQFMVTFLIALGWKVTRPRLNAHEENTVSAFLSMTLATMLSDTMFGPIQIMRTIFVTVVAVAILVATNTNLAILNEDLRSTPLSHTVGTLLQKIQIFQGLRTLCLLKIFQPSLIELLSIFTIHSNDYTGRPTIASANVFYDVACALYLLYVVRPRKSLQIIEKYIQAVS